MIFHLHLQIAENLLTFRWKWLWDHDVQTLDIVPVYAYERHLLTVLYRRQLDNKHSQLYFSLALFRFRYFPSIHLLLCELGDLDTKPWQKIITWCYFMVSTLTIKFVAKVMAHSFFLHKNLVCIHLDVAEIYGKWKFTKTTIRTTHFWCLDHLRVSNCTTNSLIYIRYSCMKT